MANAMNQNPGKILEVDPLKVIEQNKQEKKIVEEFLGAADKYVEYNMGKIDWDNEEMPFMIVDKDAGRMYDSRNDKHLETLVAKDGQQKMQPEVL